MKMKKLLIRIFKPTPPPDQDAKENIPLDDKEDSTCSSSSHGESHEVTETSKTQGLLTPNGGISEVLEWLESGVRQQVDSALKRVLDFSHENMRLFVAAGGVRVLLKLLGRKRRIQEFVLEVLLALFESGLDWRTDFDAEEGTDMLVKIMFGSGQKSMKRAAVRAVPYLLESEDGMTAFCEAGGIQALVEALDWGGEKSRASAAKGLSVLAKESVQLQDDIALVGGLTKLRYLCTSGQASAVACMNALADVTAGNPRTQNGMATAAWVPIMYLLTSCSLDMKEAAARMMANVTEDKACRGCICSHNGAMRLLSCLEVGETQAELWMLRALINLCKETRGLRDVTENLATMTKILAHGVPGCKVEAIRCLNVAMEGNNTIVGTPDMVKSLVGILQMDENPGDKCHAVRLLSVVVDSDAVRSQFMLSRGVEALISLLGSDADGKHVTEALAKLSQHASVADQIPLQGGLDRLIGVLSGSCPNRKLSVLECISNIAKFRGVSLVVDSSSTTLHPLQDTPINIRPVLGKLMQLLEGTDRRVVSAAATCLANIIHERPLVQTAVFHLGILPKLAGMLTTSPDVSVLTVLSELSHRDECKDSFTSIGILVSMLPCATLETKRRIARLVGDFVTNRQMAEHVLNCPAHQNLLGLLESTSPGEAIHALTNIAVHSKPLQTTLATDRHIAKVVPRLKDLELSDMAEAARFIAVVVHKNVSGQNQVAQRGGIPLLVALLDLPHSKCKAMAAYALAVLAEENSSLQTSAASAGAIERLASQLADEDDKCREQAAHALSNLTCQNKRNQIVFACANPQDTLLALLERKPLVARSHACKIFSNLAQNTHSHVSMLRQSSINVLVKLLLPEENECQEWAAGCLATLASDTVEQRLIKDAGGVPPLVDLVRKGQPSMQKQAARALANISFLDEHLAEIVEEGGIPVLVDLLGSSYPGNRKHAAGALANLACNDAGNSRLIIEAGGIQKLLHLLCQQEESCRTQGLRAIRNLACSPDTQKALIDAGALPILAALFKEAQSDRSDYQKLVKAIVGLVADDDNAQLTVMQDGMVDVLLMALRHGGINDQDMDEVKRALLKLACGVDDEGGAHDTIQAARARCVSSILSLGPHSAIRSSEVDGGDRMEGPSYGEEDNFEGIPRHFLCPITHELMEDPVIASDGQTYERAAIAAWFKNNMTSPMTGLKLSSWTLCPNRLVFSMIQEFEGKRDQEKQQQGNPRS